MMPKQNLQLDSSPDPV